VSSPVFVGRAAEIAQLRAALERARSGSPATTAVAGEAGVGKTRLVGELLEHAQELGALTLTGGCLDVADGVVAYASIVEALRSLVRLLEREELDRVLDGARAELTRLVPELGPQVEPVGTLPPGRLFELLLGVLHRLAERRPVVLVAEDVHWADRSTRDLLGFLVRNLRGGVALVLTYRSDELHRRHPLRPFLAELDRSGRAERLEVARLDRGELAELLTEIHGETPAPGLVDEILARSDGNPFFAEELLAARVEGVELPDNLRDLLLARVEKLPEETQRLLQVAAVAGRQVDHQLLAEVAGLPPERLVELVREAVSHHFLVVQDGGEEYAFRHALVQEAIYDDLLPMQRVPLHAACAQTLAQRAHKPTGRRTDRGPAALLGQLAHHWYAARNLGEALVASVRAGQAAEVASALPEAQQHYQRALALWEQAPEVAVHSPLDHRTLLQRAAMSMVGDPAGAITLVRQALAETEPATEPFQAGVLLERLARYQWLSGDSGTATAIVERALATIPTEPSSPERARALASSAQMLMANSRHSAAQARCQEAVAVARKVGARAEESHALTTLGISLACQGHLEAALTHLEQAHRIAEELGDPEARFRAHLNRSEALLRNGRCTEAMDVALECHRLAIRFGALRTYGVFALAYAGEALVLLGRWDEAARLMDTAFALDLPDRSMMQLRLARSMLHLLRGDLASARADVVAVQDSYQDPQDAARTFSLLATVATWEGRPEDGRAGAGKGLALLSGVVQPDLVVEVCLAGLEAEAAIAERAAASRADGEQAEAARIAESLTQHARAATTAEGVVLTGRVRATLLTAEAHFSRATGRSDPDRWAAAAAAWDRLGYPWPAAYARWRQVEALLGAGASRKQAGPILQQAWATASDLGARSLLAEVEGLGRRARIELAPAPSEAGDSGARNGATTDNALHERLGLTPREREVLELVAEGQTNRQIAELLYISYKTAGVHVSNILAKLGVANRAEAAVAAHRLGLTRTPSDPP